MIPAETEVTEFPSIHLLLKANFWKRSLEAEESFFYALLYEGTSGNFGFL